MSWIVQLANNDTEFAVNRKPINKMNEITLYNSMQNPLDAIDRFGVMMAKSGMFGCDNENAGKVLAMICMCEKKSPTEIIRQYDIVSGKLRKKALASFADFRAKGGKVKWLKTGEDGLEAKAEFTFEGQTITVGFTIEQAKKSDASFKPGSNWVKTPGNMLRARCCSNAIAMLAPEIFAGGEESESDDAPVAEINMSRPVIVSNTTSPTSIVEPQTTSKVLEAEVIQATHISQSSPNLATPQPTAISTPLPAPAIAPAGNEGAAASSGQPAVGSISDEIVLQIENAICGAFKTVDNQKAAIDAAMKWLRAQTPPWIAPGKGLETLSPKRAGNILKNTPAFLRAISEVAK